MDRANIQYVDLTCHVVFRLVSKRIVDIHGKVRENQSTCPFGCEKTQGTLPALRDENDGDAGHGHVRRVEQQKNP